MQEGRRIATLRHRELGMSVATAFMTPEPGSIAEAATALIAQAMTSSGRAHEAGGRGA